jgi:hypothetical protein
MGQNRCHQRSFSRHTRKRNSFYDDMTQAVFSFKYKFTEEGVFDIYIDYYSKEIIDISKENTDYESIILRFIVTK